MCCAFDGHEHVQTRAEDAFWISAYDCLSSGGSGLEDLSHMVYPHAFSFFKRCLSLVMLRHRGHLRADSETSGISPSPSTSTCVRHDRPRLALAEVSRQRCQSLGGHCRSSICLPMDRCDVCRLGYRPFLHEDPRISRTMCQQRLLHLLLAGYFAKSRRQHDSVTH